MPSESPVVPVPVAAPAITSIQSVKSALGTKEDSDIFICRRETVEEKPAPVTLFVFGWHNVEPGPLSWPFPSLKTAVDAVRTMRNAAQWCIVSGNDWPSMDAARASGAVLVEELG